MSEPKQYPQWVCIDCGNRYGRKLPARMATWHNGKCDACGKDKAVTEPRDFGHLFDGWQEHKKQ